MSGSRDISRLAVIGAGYVGLIQALGMAKLGFDVVCIDVDEARVSALREGRAPIYEDGLGALLEGALADGAIRFTTSIAEIAGCGAAFIAVGTPSNALTGGADLQYVWSAAADVAEHATPGTIIVVKSTVPIGTCERLQAMLDSAAPGRDLEVVSNPEFLREGSAVHDFMRPERIVIGARSADALRAVASIYTELSERNAPVVEGDWQSAETIKYASNAFLATKITFMNEIANLTEAIGGDIDVIARGVGLDRRIGDQFLRVGPGFGGSCFPKDTLALATTARRHGVQQRILDAVIAVNDARRYHILQTVRSITNRPLSELRVGVLGLAFKAGTDDVRDSPAIALIHSLLEEGVTVRAYDPVARPRINSANFAHATTVRGAAQEADLLILATEWRELADYDFASLNDVVRDRMIYDLRRVLRHRTHNELGGWRVAMIGSPVPGHSKSAMSETERLS